MFKVYSLAGVVGAILAVSLFVLFTLYASGAFGQQKIFPLNQELTEVRVILCLKKEEEIVVVDRMAQWDMDRDVISAVVQHQVRAKKCVPVREVPVTYSRMVYESPVGYKARVYQGTVNGHQVFVPTQGYEHESL